jgi:hypothetical protein
MKLSHAVEMLVAVLAAAAVFVPATAAMLLPRGAITAPVVLSVPAGHVVVPTVWMLPAATYPWVQPNWVKIGGVLRPIVPVSQVGVTSFPSLRLVAH